jgi:hypothetical protein
MTRTLLHAARPCEGYQLEQLVDASAWLPARATVPPGAINATRSAVDGMHRLAELGLAEGAGDRLQDRWRATHAPATSSSWPPEDARRASPSDHRSLRPRSAR